MPAHELLEIFQTAAPSKALIERLASGGSASIKGVVGAMKSLLVIHLQRTLDRPVLYFSSDVVTLEGVKEDIALLGGSGDVGYLPSSALSGLGIQGSNLSIKNARLRTLEALVADQADIVISHCSGLLKQLPPKMEFKSQKISLGTGQTIDFQNLIPQLVKLGFVREARVDQPGEMCVRGGIIDVYPHTAANPVRIEFWDDSVESLRGFDPATQRSTDSIAQIDLYPQEYEGDEEPGRAKQLMSLLDYAEPNALVVLDDPPRIKKTLDPGVGANISSASGELVESTVWSAVSKRVHPFTSIELISIGQGSFPGLIDYKGKELEPFKGDLKRLQAALKSLGKAQNLQSIRAFFVCETELQASRLQDIFADEGIEYPFLRICALGIHCGFSLAASDLVVYTDHQFFGRSKRLKLPTKAFKGLGPGQLKKLRKGDYVVHVDYGIGKFLGLKKVRIRGHDRECLHLEYRDGDKVYVLIERMDRVNKYTSKEAAAPKLSKLGSPEWQRLKNRTKKKIKDIAKDLIQIYAQRKARSGFAFDEDSLWQRELEASFPFEDTPDQVTASSDVKKDMESRLPMDRLVCGDVGFGKTEIAVRAAFKAALSGTQVAMLVPTTILANQHYSTFTERLARFPVNIEMLSRFRTAAQQKTIARQIKSGEVDILIGTHRILSKDVEFKNLGMVIIDEEQRFGVRHKERLKRFRATVDVLTLTATPIPRTLQFSLMGARDVSYIDTPPKNRLPIITEILPFNREHIRELILRELERDGQVFFVHNRVRSIERIARMLIELVPEARIVVAHGQMHERELERVMIDFAGKKYNILVSTMIIESGLDMANVNTIIVNRADQLGLAQLYQLRGRVGRSHLRAFAYMIIPPVETLTDTALKRLHALEEFSEIGSGRMLAMRDLEIRGAGNLLGSEQTGFIDALGFELYAKVLDDAVKELQEERLPTEDQQVKIDTQIDIDCDAFLPDNYIDSGVERVDIYRRLTELKTMAELDEISLEIRDRFGRMPEEVENLLHFIALRILAASLRLKNIVVQNEEMKVIFSPDVADGGGEQFKKWVGSTVNKATRPIQFFHNEAQVGLQVDLGNGARANKLSVAQSFLSELRCIPEEEIV